MKKTKKIALLIVVVALVAAIGVGATLAYFTDKDSASNIVTMGHVDIDLWETTTGAEFPTKGITFLNVMPGATLDKEPSVLVNAGSADCFIRVKMDITTDSTTTLTAAEISDLFDALEAQITANGPWAYNSNDGYFYCTESKAAGDFVNFFTTVTIPATWGNEAADQSFNISLQAEAIQASYVHFNATNVCWADANNADLTSVTIQQYK